MWGSDHLKLTTKTNRNTHGLIKAAQKKKEMSFKMNVCDVIF